MNCTRETSSCFYTSPLGTLELFSDGSGLCGARLLKSGFIPASGPESVCPSPLLVQAILQLDEYFQENARFLRFLFPCTEQPFKLKSGRPCKTFLTERR